MTEAEYLKDLRIALEEANRIFLHIDNFYWALSSFILAGTGFAVSKALDWGGKNEGVVILGIIMIAAWILFLLFSQNISNKAEFYETRVKYYENKLKIDVLSANEIKGGVPFRNLMIIAAYSSCFIWCAFIIEYIAKPH